MAHHHHRHAPGPPMPIYIHGSDSESNAESLQLRHGSDGLSSASTTSSNTPTSSPPRILLPALPSFPSPVTGVAPSSPRIIFPTPPSFLSPAEGTEAAPSSPSRTLFPTPPSFLSPADKGTEVSLLDDMVTAEELHSHEEDMRVQDNIVGEEVQILGQVQDSNVASARADVESKASWHEEAKNAEKGNQANAMPAPESPADFYRVRVELDWEERRYPHQHANGRTKKKWACLFPSCKDKDGNPKLFSRLEAFNIHRVKCHVGSKVVFSAVQNAMDDVSTHLNAPVRSLHETDARRMYMRLHRLKSRALVLYSAELQCACDTHKDIVIEAKNAYLEHFKSQGLVDIALRKEGVRVPARNSIKKPPTSCIVCHGDIELTDIHKDTHGASSSLFSTECEVEHEHVDDVVPDGENVVLEGEAEHVMHENVEDLCERLCTSLPRTRARSASVKDAHNKGVEQVVRRSSRKRA